MFKFNKSLLLVFLIALTVFVVLLIFLIYRLQKQNYLKSTGLTKTEEEVGISSYHKPQPRLTTSIAPTLPSPRPIPRGKTDFSISTAASSGPQMRKGFIDPYDPRIGEKQTISITVKDSSPVQSVNVTMKTDKGVKEYPMKLLEGTEIDGRWEGTWVVEDTHLYTYNAVLKAVGKSGGSTVEITLR